MRYPIHRRELLRAGLALCAAFALPAARACEFYAATLRVTHPWTRATEPGAAHALLCMKIDEVSRDDRLIGVETPVAAGAELVRDGAASELSLAIPKGRELLLEEAGTHIRLVGLAHPLEVARSYPLKLVFEQGGSVLTTLNVDYASEAPVRSFSSKFPFVAR